MYSPDRGESIIASGISPPVVPPEIHCSFAPNSFELDRLTYPLGVALLILSNSIRKYFQSSF